MDVVDVEQGALEVEWRRVREGQGAEGGGVGVEGGEAGEAIVGLEEEGVGEGGLFMLR